MNVPLELTEYLNNFVINISHLKKKEQRLLHLVFHVIIERVQILIMALKKPTYLLSLEYRIRLHYFCSAVWLCSYVRAGLNFQLSGSLMSLDFMKLKAKSSGNYFRSGTVYVFRLTGS